MKTDEGLVRLLSHETLNGLLSGENNSTAGISEREGMRLAWLAQQIPTGGDIVEIGTHRGKSICWMGTACREAGNTTARVFGVDLWTKGRTFAHYSSAETWQIFTSQVAKMGLTGFIRPVMMSSMDAVAKRQKPIHLLFIDANHKYPFVREDYLAWSRFVAPGGWIAFHDYTVRFSGVVRVVDELVKPSGLWEEGRVDGRLWSARRLPNPQPIP